MRILALLLLVLAFLGNAAAGQVSGLDRCCPDDACHLVDCAEMGCLPAGPVALPASLIGTIAVPAAADWVFVPAKEVENRVEDIWAPPD